MKREIKQTPLFHRDHFFVTILIVIISCLFVFIPIHTSFFNPVYRAFEDFSLSDLFLQFTDRENKPESNEVFIIDITSVRKRGDMANVLSEVIEMKPEVIVLDVLFENTDFTPEDLSLTETICSSSIPILSAIEYRKEETGDFRKISSYFSEACELQQGYVNTTVENSYSKSLRSYTTSQFLKDGVVPSLPMLAATVYKGTKDKDFKERLINYTDVKIKVVKPTDLAGLENRIEGKLVILGIASGREDIHLTPVGDLSGPEIVGYAIYSIINKRYIKQMSRWLGVLLGIFLGFFYVVACSFIHLNYPKTDNIRIKTLQLSSMVALIFINLLVSFYFNYNIDLVYILVFLVLVGDTLSFYIYLQMWFKKKGWFKRFPKSLYV